MAAAVLITKVNPSPICSNGRRYPERPIAGVGALIFSAGKLLLVQRANEPYRGWWSLPGGAIELGERAEEALHREVREETGLEVEIERLGEVFDRIIKDDEGRTEYHYLLLDYVCRPAGGSLLPGSDAASLSWVSREEIGALRLTSGTLEVAIRNWPNEAA